MNSILSGKNKTGKKRKRPYKYTPTPEDIARETCVMRLCSSNHFGFEVRFIEGRVKVVKTVLICND